MSFEVGHFQKNTKLEYGYIFLTKTFKNTFNIKEMVLTHTKFDINSGTYLQLMWYILPKLAVSNYVITCNRTANSSSISSEYLRHYFQPLCIPEPQLAVSRKVLLVSGVHILLQLAVIISALTFEWSVITSPN